MLKSLLVQELYPEEFLVKRPFFAQLRDRRTGATLAAATVADPSS